MNIIVHVFMCLFLAHWVIGISISLYCHLFRSHHPQKDRLLFAFPFFRLDENLYNIDGIKITEATDALICEFDKKENVSFFDAGTPPIYIAIDKSSSDKSEVVARCLYPREFDWMVYIISGGFISGACTFISIYKTSDVSNETLIAGIVTLVVSVMIIPITLVAARLYGSHYGKILEEKLIRLHLMQKNEEKHPEK